MKKRFLIFILFIPLLLSWSEPYKKYDMTNLINDVYKVELNFYNVDNLDEAHLEKEEKLNKKNIKFICEIEPQKIMDFKNSLLNIDLTVYPYDTYILWYSIFMYTDKQIVVFSLTDNYPYSYISINSVSVFDLNYNYQGNLAEIHDIDGYYSLINEYFSYSLIN